MAADFAQLYARLGIQADCSLEDFKRACRRLIQAQHPDLAGAEAAATGKAGIPLVEVLALYEEALRFHRVHGRLPGAAPPAPTPAQPSMPAPPLRAAAPGPAPAPGAPATAEASPPRRSLRGPLLALLAVAAVLTALDTTQPDEHETEPRRRQPADDARSMATAPADAIDARMRLEIGMNADDVRRIQGDPVQWSPTLWTYGPSWLLFEDDVLVDWYSSPLHPLRTASASPRESSETPGTIGPGID